MYTDLYFNNSQKTITALAVNSSDKDDVYSSEAPTALEAINDLCRKVADKHGNVVAGAVMMRLRELYANIVNLVIRDDCTGCPSIWEADCNHYNHILKLMT